MVRSGVWDTCHETVDPAGKMSYLVYGMCFVNMILFGLVILVSMHSYAEVNGLQKQSASMYDNLHLLSSSMISYHDVNPCESHNLTYDVIKPAKFPSNL